MIAPFLCIPPSFVLSGVVPVLYTLTQAIVEYLPAVPVPGPQTELPLAFLDGLTRAYLLCNIVPPSVTSSTSSVISASPWTLLVSSLVCLSQIYSHH